MQKWVPLVLMVLLLASACERRGQAGMETAAAGGRTAAPASAEAAPGGAGTSEPGEVVPSREITLQRQTAPSQGQNIAAPTGPAARLYPLRSPSRLPEDFRIGPLADRLAPGGQERKIAGAAEDFLAGLVSGTLREDIILPENREELSLSLRYYLARELVPQRFRLGTIYFDREAAGPETAWMNIRLFGSPGIAEGELYLSTAGGTWYVADVQVGFAVLGEPYEPETDKYIPSVYGWRLQ